MGIKLATLRRIYMAPAEEGSDLGGNDGALDIETRIGNALFSGGEGDNDDSDDVVVEDAGKLPETDDTDDDDNVEDHNEDDMTLAKHLGLDDDALEYDDAGNVVFNATINGEKKQVKMQDLIKSYQLEGHINQKSMKLEQDNREFVEMRDKAYNELAGRLNAANELIKVAETSILAEFQSIDWDTLRATNPAEWSALRQHYAERANQLTAIKQSVGQSQKGLTDEQLQAQLHKKQQFLQAEMQKMIVDNPSWADETVMQKEVGEIGKFLLDSYGFKPEEVANAMDARLMRMIRDAQAYRSGKTALQEKQIPKNVPKFRKQGASTEQLANLQKARDAKATKQRIKKSGGSVDAIASALVNRM